MLQRSLYFSSEKEDNYKDIKEESLNNYEDIFSDYEKSIPSLSNALSQMFKSEIKESQKVKELTEEIISKCKSKIDGRFDKIKNKYNNITKKDAYIICSYTCELDEESQYSPYKMLNKNLVADDRKKGIKKISQYFFLLLKTLRKLPRFSPQFKKLYRCINRQVSLTEDPNNKKLVPYKIGNFKTLWAFTSTSLNPKSSYEFLNDEGNEFKSGTVFTYQGDDLWGYNINLFSYYYQKEEEVLIEPERKIFVDNVLPSQNGIINVTCTIMKAPLILQNVMSSNEEPEEKEEESHIKDNKPSNSFNYRRRKLKEEGNRFQYKSRNNGPRALKDEGYFKKDDDNEIEEINRHEENKKRNFIFIKDEESQDNNKFDDSNRNKNDKLCFSCQLTNKLTLKEENTKNKDCNKKITIRQNYSKERVRNNKISEFEEKNNPLRKSHDKSFYEIFEKNFFDNRYNNRNDKRNRNNIKTNYDQRSKLDNINEQVNKGVKGLKNLGYNVILEDEILNRVVEKSKFEK